MWLWITGISTHFSLNKYFLWEDNREENNCLKSFLLVFVPYVQGKSKQIVIFLNKARTYILCEQVLPATSSRCTSQHRKQQLGFISQEMLCNLSVPWRTSFPPESDTPTPCKKRLNKYLILSWVIAFRGTKRVSKGCSLKSACLNWWEKQSWVVNFSARRMCCQCREMCILFILCDGREVRDRAGRKHGP